MTHEMTHARTVDTRPFSPIFRMGLGTRLHTDLLICHCTKQDLSRTIRYLGITYDKPTARTATVSVSTYARTKVYTSHKLHC